jgi:hypothetical protein
MKVLENPETGDIIFLNQIIKIKQYKCDSDGYYKYSILTTDNYYTDFYTRVPHFSRLLIHY